MIVKQNNLQSVISKLSGREYLAFDVETTGTEWFKDDRLFSMAIGPCAEGEYYYFDERILGNLTVLSPLFEQETTFFAHNAKFELHMLDQSNISLPKNIHCTYATHRLVNNTLLNYKLEALAKIVNEKKLVEKIKNKDFYGAKIEDVSTYCKKDTEITYKLGIFQLDKINQLTELTKPLGGHTPLELFNNEKRLTKTCFNMEKTGVLIDLDYCLKAIEHEKIVINNAKKAYTALAQKPYIDSGKSHANAFNMLGYEYLTTDLGNPCFDAEALDFYNNDLSKLIKDIRFYQKRVSTYWANFITLQATDKKIRANIKQAGTETGRMSYSNPNLQNLPKDDSSAYPIRAAIIPSPGFVLCSIDFEQMEYRLLLDYAKEIGVIDKIKSGLDVHQATAEVMNVTRQQAKTINFMLLYGGGVDKLAMALKESKEKAKALKHLYFLSLPNVKIFINDVMTKAKHRGFLKNWAGRINRCMVPEWAYIMPNHLIQGGCADIVKIAMNKIDEFLQGRKSRMIIQVHDEIVLEIHETEMHLIPEIKAIMEAVYPYKYLPMSCDVSLSHTNWHDKIKQ